MTDQELNLAAVLVGIQLTLVAIYLAVVGSPGGVLSGVSIILAVIGTIVSAANLY
ncbi:hypothetical protein [Haloparvum alkalitolerans]|uniref:hypothetical protein n=1 Tax=Haloparvum alkalitolerans TaxID=1042953 RepID=UPI003CEF44EA